MIIASNSMRAKLSSKFVAEIEESIEPLVLFMPSQKETAAEEEETIAALAKRCLLYTSPSPRDGLLSRMPSSA